MTGPSARTYKIFLIAGEPSGDILGASLMRGLKEELGANNVQFSGVGGSDMEEEGMSSLFPMSDLSVMGLAEVLPRLGTILRRINETTEAAAEERPDAVISIDSPDFSFRVQKKLRQRFGRFPDSPQLIHYVAPTVWAWRPGRAQKIAAFLDHLLALFPFEPPYFERVELSCDFVGHPVTTYGISEADGQAFRKDHGIAPDEKLLCVLPGSRMSEVSRLLPVFAQTLHKLRDIRKDTRICVPLVSGVAPYIKDSLAERGITDVIYTRSCEDKFAAFNAADAALAASGTVSLELAAARLPHVIAYRVSALSAFIGRRLIKTPYANLVNVILDKMVVPELLQENCKPEQILDNLLPLLSDTPERTAQADAFDNAIAQLNPPDGVTPGQAAAKSIIARLK